MVLRVGEELTRGEIRHDVNFIWIFENELDYDKCAVDRSCVQGIANLSKSKVRKASSIVAIAKREPYVLAQVNVSRLECNMGGTEPSLGDSEVVGDNHASEVVAEMTAT
jgi:hypothetical protein